MYKCSPFAIKMRFFANVHFASLAHYDYNYLSMNDVAKTAQNSRISSQRFPRVSVSAMLVYTRQKNIAQVFILERYFFVSIYPAAIPGTYLAMFLVAVLQLC